ncbi:MAG: hypothetical protein HN916_16465 [Anaerolineae bacterium]|jgi:hypothetical protein|nr:hypothetical protein [Anaerolineae bacterium]
MPKFTKKSIPFLFAILTLLAYGLLTPWVGFHWDDWAFAWIGNFLGPTEFIPAFRPFRPFIAPIFVATTSIIPPIPFVWQIFGLVIRFFSAFAAWWALNQIWTKNKTQNLAVSLLFLLYPGYSQQWVALTHINQEWISLIAYLFSFGLTAQALRTGKKRKTLLALLLLFWGLFPTEYFVSIEPLRALFIFFMLGETMSKFWIRIKESAKRWLPYLALWLVNVAWLAYYYTRGGYNSYSVEASQKSTSALAELITGIWDLLYKSLWMIWTQFIPHYLDSPTAPTAILGLALVILAFSFLIIYHQNLTLKSTAKKHLWTRQAIFIGFVGIFLGRVPSLLAGLPLKIGSTFDRLTISIMFASALLVAGLLELLIKNEKWRNLILSGLLALAVGQQFLSANEFRRDWERQKNLAWQLTWRIPAMKEGTALITHELPMVYESDQAMTAPLNWIYAPNYQAGDLLPYAFVNTEKRLGGYTLPSLEMDMPIKVPYRTVRFEGNTSAAIVIYAPKNGCLRVLDSVYANAQSYKKEDDFLTDAIYLSDPSRILTDAETPDIPASLFGKEPAHEWCYYSTKAELARQQGDWEEVARLGDQAETEGYHPVDAFEWLPFIEGYAYTDNLERAENLSQIAIQKEPRLRKGLCQLWARAEVEIGNAKGENIAQNMQTKLSCSP